MPVLYWYTGVIAPTAHVLRGEEGTRNVDVRGWGRRNNEVGVCIHVEAGVCGVCGGVM
jgi:hypothetical protein